MSLRARDRSARSRIRAYLRQHGPIEDAAGRATSLLKDAVEYEGNAVAFIQLVTAMDKAGEIERVVRGKRTYRISAVAADRPVSPAGVAGVVALTVGGTGAGVVIDYDELARAVVRELARAVLSSGLVGTAADAARVERDRLMAERDEYARRLQIARQQLSALLDESMPVGSGAKDAPGALDPGKVGLAG